MLHKLIMFNDTTKPARERADTDSTASCEWYAQKEMQILIDDQESLQQAWTEMKCGAYAQASQVEVIFHPTDAYRKLSKLRHLDEFFRKLGSSPFLEHLVFTKSDLLVSSVCKLLKRSSLKSLKFHQCTVIAKKLEDTAKLWTALAPHRKLACLEIVDCKYTNSETLCRHRVHFTYEIPAFLVQSTALERLALDYCLLENDRALVSILQNTSSLQELEIRPNWQVSPSIPRRQQFQAKMRFIGETLVDTIPNCLASNRNMTKLVVSLEDYHLEEVYVEALESWMDLVQYDNSTLKEMRLTHRPLSEQEETEGEDFLRCRLQSMLRLNQLLRSSSSSSPEAQTVDKKESQDQTDTSLEEWEHDETETCLEEVVQHATTMTPPSNKTPGDEIWV